MYNFIYIATMKNVIKVMLFLTLAKFILYPVLETYFALTPFEA